MICDIEKLTEQEFEAMLQKWHSAQRFYWTGSVTNQFYLINRQERSVIEIKNQEVIKFLYTQMYIATVPNTFIDAFVNVWGFAKQEYL